MEHSSLRSLNEQRATPIPSKMKEAPLGILVWALVGTVTLTNFPHFLNNTIL